MQSKSLVIFFKAQITTLLLLVTPALLSATDKTDFKAAAEQYQRNTETVIQNYLDHACPDLSNQISNKPITIDFNQLFRNSYDKTRSQGDAWPILVRESLLSEYFQDINFLFAAQCTNKPFSMNLSGSATNPIMGDNARTTVQEFECANAALVSDNFSGLTNLLDKMFANIGGSKSTISTLEQLSKLSLHVFRFAGFELIGEFSTQSHSSAKTYWTSVCIPLLSLDKSPTPTKDANQSDEQNSIDSTVLYKHIGQHELRILGQIDARFPTVLDKLLSAEPNIRIVSLGSTGGTLISGIQAGEIIRKHGVYTTLYSDCDSSCTFAFFGGKRRWFDSDLFTLGLHEISIDGQTVKAESSKYEISYIEIEDFLLDVDVNVDFVVSRMQNNIGKPLDLSQSELEAAAIISSRAELSCDESVPLLPRKEQLEFLGTEADGFNLGDWAERFELFAKNYLAHRTDTDLFFFQMKEFMCVFVEFHEGVLASVPIEIREDLSKQLTDNIPKLNGNNTPGFNELFENMIGWLNRSGNTHHIPSFIKHAKKMQVKLETMCEQPDSICVKDDTIPNQPELDNREENNGSMISLVGLWAYSITGDSDEYFEIISGNQLIRWDYQGAQNCYRKEGPHALTQHGNELRLGVDSHHYAFTPKGKDKISHRLVQYGIDTIALNMSRVVDFTSNGFNECT